MSIIDTSQAVPDDRKTLGLIKAHPKHLYWARSAMRSHTESWLVKVVSNVKQNKVLRKASYVTVNVFVVFN